MVGKTHVLLEKTNGYLVEIQVYVEQTHICVVGICCVPKYLKCNIFRHVSSIMFP